MNKKSRCILFVLVFVALYLFVFNGTGNAGSQWIIYDDEVVYATLSQKYQGVRFSLYSRAMNAPLTFLSGVSFYYQCEGNPDIHITEDDHVTELPNSPISAGVSGAGWHYVDLSSYNIEVPQNFYVIIELGDEVLGPVVDEATDTNRSFAGVSLSGLTGVITRDLLIRAKVEFPSPNIVAPLLLLEE